MPYSENIRCLTPGCGGRRVGKGRCVKCYEDWQIQNGYPNGKCRGQECDLPVSSKSLGLCHSHACRYRRHKSGQKSQGDPLRPLGSRQPCSISGCKRVHSSHGYCRYHKKRVVDGFVPASERPKGPPASCRVSECSRQSQQAGYCTKHYARFYRYKLSPTDFEGLIEGQGGRCAICDSRFDMSRPGLIHVDHDHGCCAGGTTCGECVRGLLCRSCNWGLGNFSDDPRRLDAAIRYLSATGGQP
ncbi:endonuclease VII [Gordonia phage BrutonGaster]|uniref:Endonuclease VII n=1 Tax=Gordonia phage BrutonGaster TaxID=2530116 RepID=A0A482JHG1_9CAUD|nr:endonuclease VII [Gordonia phage BrutonGaster]QBP33388.1 endonuclease VII [Gordonia phage BrutonGaster]